MTETTFWCRAAALEQQLFSGRLEFKTYRMLKAKLLWEFEKSNK